MGRNLGPLNIKDSYEGLVQISGSQLTDGSGSLISSLDVTASYASNAGTSGYAGTAGFADTSTSASWADQSGTSGFATTALSASFATTASYALNVPTFDTGSLMVTGSVTDATLTFTKGDGSTFPLTVNNVANATSALLAVSASHAVNADNAITAQTASFLPADTNLNINSITASNASFTSASIGYLQTITGSAKIIGDAFIILNNNLPTERYAGLVVQDSGSGSPLTTSSLQYDGQTDDWFYEYSTDGGVTTDHGVAMFGPEYSVKGVPTYNTANTILKGDGGHHILDSSITDDGTLVTINANVSASGYVSASTYYGDGSNLSGIVTDPFPYTGSAEITGSLGITGSLNVLGNIVSGGPTNIATNVSASVIGGLGNTASGVYSATLGGQNLTAGSGRNVVLGGNSNSATNNNNGAMLGGSGNNITGGEQNAIVGGQTNTSTAKNGGVFVGRGGSATGEGSAVIGGLNGLAQGYGAMSLGGDTIKARAFGSSVLSGGQNEVTSAGTYGSIVGGSGNTVSHVRSVVVGGNGLSTTKASEVVVPDLSVYGETFISSSALGTGSLIDNLGQEAIVTGSQVQHIVNLSQAEYDALTPDANTLYVIDGAETLGDTVISGSLIGEVNTLTNVAGTTTLDCSLGNYFTLSMPSGTTTVLEPTNIQAGQTINIRIEQNASASTLTYDASIEFPGGTAFTISTGAGQVDILTLVSFDGIALQATGLANFS